MTVRSSDQITIVDVTDAYSVILTSESHTFPGSATTAKAGSTTTQLIAMQGASQVACSVTVSEITKPSGVTVSTDSDATSPTLTIAVDTTVTTGGAIRIPVHIGDLVINKDFTFAIAYTGASGSSVKIKTTAVTYQASDSGTTTPTGTWSSTIPDVNPGQYLWTKTSVTYSDGATTTAYSIARMGNDGAAGKNGTSVTVKSSSVTYQVADSGTTTPTGTWATSVPTVSAGKYLWTKTVVTYSDGKSTTSYSISRNGTNGSNGKNGTNGKDGSDAISIAITSSNGTIFKNTAISTTLTAHVYKGGAEMSGDSLSALGTLKWYKDGSTTATATGASLVIDAGDVSNKASYVVQLED